MLRLRNRSIWWPDNQLSLAKLDPSLLAIMSGSGSLTQVLVGLSNNNFSVNVLSQKVAVPKFHEQKMLGYPLSRAALIREVELQLFGDTVVFARSIIPLRLINKGRYGLANLGTTPLGHLLFNSGEIKVSRRQFAQFDIDTLTISARRTPYDYQESQILVSEFFLPKIYEFI